MQSGDQNANGGASQRSRRTQLVLIMGVALVCLGGSYLMYFVLQGGGFATTNNGEFVQPPVTAQALGVQAADGSTFATEQNWWLLLVVENGCDNQCALQLKNLRAMQVLLAKDASRVRRAWLSRQGNSLEAGIAVTYPRLTALTAPFRTTAASMREGVYIVDPIGNLVLVYPKDTNPKLVLEDLKRLLKVSQIG